MISLLEHVELALVVWYSIAIRGRPTEVFMQEITTPEGGALKGVSGEADVLPRFDRQNTY